MTVDHVKLVMSVDHEGFLLLLISLFSCLFMCIGDCCIGYLRIGIRGRHGLTRATCFDIMNVDDPEIL